MYNVDGIDKQGKFFINRRYNEFFVLRNCMVQRYPGLYIPQIPQKSKSFYENKNNSEFLETRCFFLNLFIKQFVRCPYLYQSEEFQIFTRSEESIDRVLSNLPLIKPSKMLQAIAPFYSITGSPDHSILLPIHRTL